MTLKANNYLYSPLLFPKKKCKCILVRGLRFLPGKNLEEVILQNEATINDIDAQLKASEQREIELRQKLEESERARAELERLMGSVTIIF